MAGQRWAPIYTPHAHMQDIISGAICSLLFFAVSIPMDIYYGKWTDISGIIEYIFQTNLILDLNSFVDGASGAKGLFNLDQLIPATGAAAVCC